MISITDRISYIPASSSPLSADVGIIRGDDCIYLYDVGNCEESLQEICSLSGEKRAVLSHFHPDHKGNLNKLNCELVYLSEYTKKHLPDGEERSKDKLGKDELSSGALLGDREKPFYNKLQLVTDKVTIQDGVCIELFPIPSSHAKGCLGMTVDHKYTFLGDATYSTRKKGETVYNVQFLKEELELLKDLDTEYFLVSHEQLFSVKKHVLIRELEYIYAKRNKNDAYIILD